MSATASTATLVTGSVDSVAANLKAEEAAGQKPRRLTQYMAAISAGLGAFALGTVIGWSSPASSHVQGGPLQVTPSEFAWVGSLLTLGAAASNFPAGYLVDKIGRKQTMFWTAVPFAIGWALILWASSVNMLYVGRVITGFCGGVFCVACNLYVGEIAEKEIRGTLGTLFQLNVVIGIEFTYLVGAFASFTVLNSLCLAVPVIFAFIFFWMPETPQYLLKARKRSEAYNALRWFRGGAECDLELREMELACESEREQSTSLKQSFTGENGKAARVALLVSIGLMACQQLSGINAVIFYTEDLFKAAGSSLEARYTVVIVGAVQIIATVAALMVVDRLGRRALMGASQAVMALSTLLLGVYLYYREGDAKSVEGIGWLPIIFVCLYLVAFSVGAGPIPWLTLGELFPSEVKGFASAFSSCFNWLLAFLVTRFFGDLVSAINGSGAFWLFTALLLLGLAFVYFFLPETRGKSLEQIQAMLARQPDSSNASHFSQNITSKGQHNIQMDKF
ncbi:facilitated trehalose transporter Tret1-like [Cloeon dipterum]|uniref:facilitated trehalose transporter Tret1-like n=1 Tax=Cloeon dipterum TaxID=197152 RepID=UPI00321F71CB